VSIKTRHSISNVKLRSIQIDCTKGEEAYARERVKRVIVRVAAPNVSRLKVARASPKETKALILLFFMVV
jgi:hypothetical protein